MDTAAAVDRREEAQGEELQEFTPSTPGEELPVQVCRLQIHTDPGFHGQSSITPSSSASVSVSSCGCRSGGSSCDHSRDLRLSVVLENTAGDAAVHVSGEGLNGGRGGGGRRGGGGCDDRSRDSERTEFTAPGVTDHMRKDETFQLWMLGEEGEKLIHKVPCNRPLDMKKEKGNES